MITFADSSPVLCPWEATAFVAPFLIYALSMHAYDIHTLLSTRIVKWDGDADWVGQICHSDIWRLRILLDTTIVSDSANNLRSYINCICPCEITMFVLILIVSILYLKLAVLKSYNRHHHMGLYFLAFWRRFISFALQNQMNSVVRSYISFWK